MACASFPRLGAIGIYVDRVMVAFHIYELVGRGWAVGHFTKAVREPAGASLYGWLEVARSLRLAGVHTLNYEQDLGIPGLRDFKRRLRPIGFLRKFSIAQR
jgi:hypothetical protein